MDRGATGTEDTSEDLMWVRVSEQEGEAAERYAELRMKVIETPNKVREEWQASS